MKKENDKWIGRRINDWTVVGYVNGKNGVEWMCECKCGRIKRQKVWNVKSGRSRKCRICSDKEGRKKRNE